MGQEISLLTALAAGVVSFLSPCVLPLVPGYLSFISGVSMEQMRAEERDPAVGRAVLVNTLAFILGFSIVFVALGATATSLGSALLANQRWLQRLAGAVVIAFGLHFLGVFRIAALYREARFHGPTKTRGPLGALLLGLAFAAGWSPCIGPILAGILALAATQDSVGQGVALLATYSAGLGIPFLLTGLATERLMDLFQRAKRLMWAIEKVGGVLLVVVGVLIFTDNFFLFQRWFAFLNRFAL